MASQSPPISQTPDQPLISTTAQPTILPSATAQSTENPSSSTPQASVQIFRLSGGSPLVTFSPYIAPSVAGQTASVSRGWSEQADASGHEMMQTFGEDVDGTWLMIANISGVFGFTLELFTKYKRKFPEHSLVSQSTAQSFTPYFTVPSDGYDITAQVDSEAPVALTQSGTKLSVKEGPSHQFRMKVACKAGGNACSARGTAAALSFQGIDLGVMSSSNVQNPIVNATIDDSSKAINYQGFASTSAPRVGTQSIVDDAVVKSSKEKTLSYTFTRGANATVYFTGSSLQIIGVAGPSMGTFSVAMDSDSSLTIANATKGIFSVQQLLFFTSNLSEGEHQMTITNLEEGKGLALDALSVSGPGVACFGKGCGAATQPTIPAPPNTLTTSAPIQTGLPAQGGTPLQTGLPGGKTNGGATAGSVIGGLLGALFAIVILLLLWRRWKKKKDKKDDKQKLNAWDEANMLTKQPNHFVRVEPKENMPYRSLGTARTHGRGPAGIAV
ncbi:hypothetical protein QFC21_006446 [Naganishia friedmannii]|uniref:Uncharacterized protein n=1 Tax=Naganishia friedmannii TaxID=89922 RepID=A0ACC2V238_9TREE|nr:hypothetical protein QFC21_006446 [Naganishia friedmannii]